ncbi:MAG TPA: FmdB family zinc ribbon protein [Acidobacteriota bacterium]|nr:FmdB family zinc ribbon protein [Acidobacteriota bacterium]
MPTYEYECEKCGHRFEVFQSMSDPPKKRCPKCKGKLRRLLGTGAGMIFKGSGFYVTDYRSESYKSQKHKESGETPKVKPESKPAPGSTDAPGSGGKKKPKKP